MHSIALRITRRRIAMLGDPLPGQWLDQWTTQECGLSVPGWTELDVADTAEAA